MKWNELSSSFWGDAKGGESLVNSELGDVLQGVRGVLSRMNQPMVLSK